MDITTHGPIFDGRAEVELRRYCDEAERVIADRALDELKLAFHETFKHPTGAYESHVHVHQDPDGHLIDDERSVYGPWLEGTGSRNFPHTRFRGYRNWRRTTQKMQLKAKEIAERLLHERYLGRIG